MRVQLLVLTAIFGCGSDPSSPQASDVPSSADGTTVAPITVSIVAPIEDELSGVVSFRVEAAPAALVASLEAVVPQGLVDTDSRPEVLIADWDTAAAPDGAVTLVFRATSTSGETVLAQRTVTLENAGTGAIGGRVLAARPVRDADVTLVAFSGLAPGLVLGSGRTDADGQFQVTVDVPGYDDLVLVRVGGPDARLPSMIGGADELFGEGEELATLVHYTDGKATPPVLVTALTTLGVPLAQARLKTSAADAVSSAMRDLLEHVFRPLPPGQDARDVAPEDVTTLASSGPDAVVAVGLVHAGLAQQAKDLGVSMPALLRALGRDLRSGVFDGKDEVGAAISVGGTPIDLDATRWRLAAAVDAFLGGPSNASGLDYDDLAADGGLYDDLSEDTGPLYPAGEAAETYDPAPPKLSFVEPTPAEDAWQTHAFAAVVHAEDKSLPVTFVVEAPAVSADALTATSNTATVTLTASAFEPGPLTLTVKGTDAAGNSATVTRTVLVDASEPEVAIVSPVDGAVVSGAALTVSGTASDTGSGVAAVTVLVGASTTLVDVVDGVWSTEVTLPGASAKIDVLATDVAGNVGTTYASVGLDTTPPIVEVGSPEAGHPYRSEGTKVEAKVVDDESGIASATATVGDAVVPLALAAASASGFVALPEAEGPAEVVVAATNGAGVATQVTVPVIVDDSVPTCTSHVLGVKTGSTRWVTSANAPLVITGLHDNGPPNGLAIKGYVKVTGDIPEVSMPFTEDEPDITVPLDLSPLLPAGQLALTLADVAGNAWTGTFDVALDDEPPDLVVTSPADNSFVSGAEVTVSGTVTDSKSGYPKVSVSVGGSVTEAGFSMDGWQADVTLPSGTGPHPILVTATDAAGNSTTTTVKVSIDATPPEFGNGVPYQGQPHQSGKLDVTIPVTDFESKVVSVEAQVDVDAPVPLAFDAGFAAWKGSVTLPEGDGDSKVTLTATNGAGGVATKVVTVLRDNSPPSMSSADLGLWNGVLGQHFVSQPKNDLLLHGVVDQGIANDLVVKGSVSVQAPALGPMVDFDSGGEVTLAIDVGALLPAGPLVVEAIDVAGNVATLTLNVTLDVSGPALAIVTPQPTGGTPEYWTPQSTVTLTGTASDAETGVVSVVATDGKTTLPAVLNGTGWTVASFPVPDPSQTIVVTATDGLGNTSTTSLAVRRDTEPPIIATVATSYKAETAALYAKPCTVPLELTAPTDVGGFVKIEKLADRLEWTTPADVAKYNLPVFQVAITDGQGATLTQMATTYRFYRLGKALTDPRPLPADQRGPVAIPCCSTAKGAKDFAWKPESLPDALVISATDLAGNTTSKSFTFELKVAAPPLCFELVTPPATTSDVTYFGYDKGNLQNMFKAGAAPTRLGQYRARNSSIVPLRFVPQADLKITTRAFGKRAAFNVGIANPQPCSAGACAVDQCRVCSFVDYTGSACEAWTAVTSHKAATPAVTRTSTFVAVSSTGSPTPLVPDAAGAYVVPAGEERFVNALVPLGDTCMLGAPSTYKDYKKHSNGTTTAASYTAYTVKLDFASGCTAAKDTAGDDAACALNDGTGVKSYGFETPQYVTELDVLPAGFPSFTQGLDGGFSFVTVDLPGLGFPSFAPAATIPSTPNYKDY